MECIPDNTSVIFTSFDVKTDREIVLKVCFHFLPEASPYECQPDVLLLAVMLNGACMN